MNKTFCLKLMTYNIGGGRKNLGSQFSNILRIIKNEKPDILAVQEAAKWKVLDNIEVDQAKNIAQNGIESDYYFFGSTLSMRENFHVRKDLFIHGIFNNWENWEQGNAVFSRWPFARLSDNDKPGFPHNIPLYKVMYKGNRDTEPRYIILSRINLGEINVFVLATHLTTLYGERGTKEIPQKSENAQMMRWEQCERILDLIKENILEKNELVFLLGDFNAMQDEPAISAILEKKGGFVRLSPENNIGTHLKHNSPVDHIFIFPGKYHIEYNCKVCDDKFTASDHNPVIANIVIYDIDTEEHKQYGKGVFREKTQ